MQKDVVQLTEQERHELQHLIEAAKTAARKLMHACILRHPPMKA